MYWDGTNWVSDRPPVKTRPATSGHRLRNVLATLPILLLVPALLLPFLSVGAASMTPSLSVSGTVVPGAMINVRGTGFPMRDWVELRWDNAPTGASARVNSRNEFTSEFAIPGGTPAGTYQISAYAATKTKGATTLASQAMAVISVTVGTPSNPTPTPSIAPTPTPVPVPTPTPAPTPSPAPSATPSPIIPGPTILSVTATSLTTSSATVIWVLSTGATGQVEYGRTAAFGSLSTPELSYTWSTHVQTLTGLTPGATYQYRVKSRTTSGIWLISPTYTFTTVGSIWPTPTPTPVPSPTATPTPTPPPSATPTPTPSATPTPPPPSTGAAYGSGLSGDSRNNFPIGSSGGKLSYRFVASTSATPTSIRVQERGGPGGYSTGNGGTIRATIQTDNGGTPSGSVRASVTWSPGNPSGNWEVFNLRSFSSASALVGGTTYHLVFENVAADAANNWISLNALFTYDGLASNPRFPAFSDTFGLLYAQPSTWSLRTSDIPIFDLTYSNGMHDGQGYIGTLYPNYGSISGSASMVRERFKVSGGSRTVTSASVKVKRISGSSPLTIRLEKGDGTLIESVTIPATSIKLGIMPNGSGAADLGGNTWASVTFTTARVLTDGQVYNLRLSTAADTQYIAVPVHEGTDKGLASYRFTDGDGQRTTDGGSSWANLYLWEPVDLQFYLR